MQLLTLEQILILQKRVIEQSGGVVGISVRAYWNLF